MKNNRESRLALHCLGERLTPTTAQNQLNVLVRMVGGLFKNFFESKKSLAILRDFS